MENNNTFFTHESARETCKNESLADDNTTLMLTTTENFAILRQILDDFSMVSGLTCNYDKTNVLMIGPPVPDVNLAGFVPTDHIKLLGLKITKNLDSFDETFSELHEKIRDLISFWDRFRLSLPGRISVIKNLLIPQLNYLACFLEPNPRILNEIQETLDSFALHGIQVARDRRYLAPKNGGLGLFDLKPFLTALKCSWIKRAFSKNIDNWRYDLKKLAPDGNIPLIHTFDVNKAEHPILYNFTSAFVEFRNALCRKDSNYRKNPIFMNPNFKRSGRDGGQIDIPFFSQQIYDNCTAQIRKLTYDDCFRNGAFKTIPEFAEMGIVLNGTVWMRLRGAMSHAKATFSEQIRKPESTNAADFLVSFKKGSKKFREVICHCPNAENERADLRIVVTYGELTDTPVPDPESLGTILSLWNCSFLPNDIREFIFKERNNCLALNNRAAHYVQNISDKCSFCRIINHETNTRESFSHLFFDCPITNLVLNGFLRISGLRIQGNDPNIRNIYWNGIVNGSLNKDLFLINNIFRYCIWKSKTRKMIPRARNILTQVSNILSTVIQIKPDIREKLQSNYICAPLLQAMG
jgi:hypothetical protein